MGGKGILAVVADCGMLGRKLGEGEIQATTLQNLIILISRTEKDMLCQCLNNSLENQPLP